MTTCPGMLPAVVSSGAGVALPGLMIGGPLAPLAAMLASGVIGGAMLGSAAGSVISCREIGMQSDSHYLVKYKEFTVLALVQRIQHGLNREGQLVITVTAAQCFCHTDQVAFHGCRMKTSNRSCCIRH